ncbi:MAG: selenocysteine-specific translation elongation factor [Dehalococcoidia bacterium]|nr:selenocysteine-specific translation elongation factor [Dehalococcoidia bacterium]
MYVLGTAGHIDHGKSVLVRALTGIDPDRLPEEKSRGMTIDLGFAWLRLPSGKEVSIVDVPGHERFVRNMLAGVGGIDLALLVVAADEGVMPQTREHLGILDLLNVKNGIVVITKKDLVDEEGLGLATMETEDVIRGTALAEAPIVCVSAVTGEGLTELLAAVDGMLEVTQQRRNIGRPRLPVDRVFTAKGFGTVVTGTLIDGELRVGEQVEVLPRGLEAHVRGIEVHKVRTELALPGNRVAVNMGNIRTGELERGMVITRPRWLKPTRLLDVKVRAVSDLTSPITHNMSVAFYTGASETAGKIRLLDREKIEAGEGGWAQVGLTSAVAAAKGDLFVIRSSRGTVGGGEIVDVHPRRHRRFQAAVIEGLKAREGSSEEAVLAVLETGGTMDLREVALQCDLSEGDAAKVLQELVEGGRAVLICGSDGRQLFCSRGRWKHLAEEARRLLQDYHATFPLRRGMPPEEFRSRLKTRPQHLEGIVGRLAEDGVLVAEGAALRLSAHSVKLSPSQQSAADAFLRTLAESPYCPPGDSSLGPDLLSLLLEQKKVVKVGEGIVFSASAYEEMVTRVTQHIGSQGTITVAEVRDLFQTSRKYAKALMEHLDAEKITLRVGDERVLR